MESKRVLDLPPGIGGMPKAAGVAERAKAWLAANPSLPGVPFLTAMISWAIEHFGFGPDKFVYELADPLTGDSHPVPDRMPVHPEIVVREYLQWAICEASKPATLACSEIVA